MDLLFIIWFLVLPALALILIPFSLIFWFLIVPGISRKLTWDRFRKVSYQMVEDDTGKCYLLDSKEELPEGVVITKHGPRFLPRALFKKNKSEEEETLEGIITRKVIWADMNKPIIFGYSGKIASTNLATLAAISNPKLDNKEHPVEKLLSEITEKLEGCKIAGEKSTAIDKLLENVKTFITWKPFTVVDLTKIKTVILKMYTPSQINAYGKNRELKGMLKAGKQFIPLILGIGLIIGLVILGVFLFSRI